MLLSRLEALSTTLLACQLMGLGSKLLTKIFIITFPLSLKLERLKKKWTPLHEESYVLVVLTPAANHIPSPSLAVSSPLSITNIMLEYSEAEYLESHTSKEIVSIVSKAPPPSEKSGDLMLDLVHMIDTGGQPELMEVIPSLIHNANIAMVLINLKYGLNECQMLDYHEEGEQYQWPHTTSKDAILKLVSTLRAKRSAGKYLCILVVATHCDCVKGDLEARVEDLNQQLITLLLPSFEEELIMFETPNKIAFVLNLKNSDEHDIETLKLIHNVVSNPCLGPEPFETPASFFAFEQDLLHCSEMVVERDILTLNECRQVGAKLGMDNDMVMTALVLFHQQNTFLYFPQVLPNHVFIKPHVPLDIVNSIIHFSYKPLRGVPAKVTALLRDGIITEELLSYDDISSHLKKGIYEVHDAIKLFTHTFILALYSYIYISRT